MTPGKFEGEPDYVPTYWAKALEGGADEDRGSSFVFVINESDHEKFPELPIGAKLYLVESSDGFVHSRVSRGSSKPKVG